MLYLIYNVVMKYVLIVIGMENKIWSVILNHCIFVLKI